MENYKEFYANGKDWYEKSQSDSVIYGYQVLQRLVCLLIVGWSAWPMKSSENNRRENLVNLLPNSTIFNSIVIAIISRYDETLTSLCFILQILGTLRQSRLSRAKWEIYQFFFWSHVQYLILRRIPFLHVVTLFYDSPYFWCPVHPLFPLLLSILLLLPLFLLSSHTFDASHSDNQLPRWLTMDTPRRTASYRRPWRPCSLSGQDSPGWDKHRV